MSIGRLDQQLERLKKPVRRPRRRLLAALLCVALALAALLLGFVIDPTQSGKIVRSNYARVGLGMPKAEVEAILGKPGDYTQPAMYWDGKALPGGANPRNLWLGSVEERGESWGRKTYDIWDGDHGSIIVSYDADDRVVHVSYAYPSRRYKWFYWLLYDTGRWDD
jgi:hypothetical protein